MVPEITPTQLAQKLASAEPPLLIDVREPDEYQYCRIEAAQLKPLGDIARWSAELDPDAEIVCQCHTGFRSGQAAQYLTAHGFKRVYNLRGGIDAWSAQVDPTVARY